MEDYMRNIESIKCSIRNFARLRLELQADQYDLNRMDRNSYITTHMRRINKEMQKLSVGELSEFCKHQEFLLRKLQYINMQNHEDDDNYISNQTMFNMF